MRKTAVLALVASTALPLVAQAGTISAVGSVTALTDISQMDQTILGTADFNLSIGELPSDTYGSEGLTFHQGDLSTILSGVSSTGTASLPNVQGAFTYFPAPIGGGGSQSGNIIYYGGVMTFTDTVTQFGLTFGRNGSQYITAWDTFGSLIGQVRWTPSSDSAFVGIDTGGVAIGMLAVGNDDIYNGFAYDIAGSTIMTDNYIWAGTSLTAVPLPASAPLLVGGCALLWGARRRKGDLDKA